MVGQHIGAAEDAAFAHQGGDAVITLRRLDEDTCREPETQGIELKWSFEELGLAPGQAVSVNNPYQLPQT